MERIWPVGSVVGARRWPYYGAHPDVWLEPLRGVVLDFRDPRVWRASSHSAHNHTYSAGEIEKEISLLMAANPFLVPVLWTDQYGCSHVFLEDSRLLRSYQQDLEEWLDEREEARSSSYDRCVSLG